MKLTEQIANISSRVGALESNNLDENAPIAQITKVYGNIKITAVVKTKIHSFKVCSESVVCSENLII